MPGVLQFTLGLATGNFVANAGKAAGAIKGLVGAAAAFAGLSSATGGIFAAFEKGAGLEHLHKRTGEAVGDLYKIQKGLKAVGLDGDAAGTLIYQLNKSLGGFNELGEPTKDVFAAIGTSVESLKQMQAPEKLLAIANALNKLDNETATNISSKIFGRAGAGDFLQMARGAKEFAEAMSGAGEGASIFGRSAAIFANIERSIEKVKNIGKGFWLGIADGLAPGFQAALDLVIKNVNLVPLGQKIGEAIGVGFEAFKEDKLGTLIELSLKAGMFEAGEYMKSLIVEWGAKIAETVPSSMGRTLAGMMNTTMAETLMDDAGKPAPNGRKNLEHALNVYRRIGRFSDRAVELQGASGGAFGANPFTATLADLMASLRRFGPGNVVYPGYPNGLQGSQGLAAAAAAAGGRSQIDRNDWERIGGFGPGGSGFADSARQTASNTSTIARLQERATRALETYLPQKFGANPMFNNIP